MFVTLVKPCANAVSGTLPAATLPPMAVRRIPGLKTGSSNRWTLIVAAVASVLLVTLAVLQYRWTGELSAAANERMRANLEESSRLLAGDIETPLAQLYTALLRVATLAEPDRAPTAGQPAQFDELLARVVRDWRRNAAFPHILDETWLVLTDRQEGTRNAFRLDEDSGRLEPGGAPADLEEAVRALRPPGRLTPTQRTDLLVIPIPTRIRSGRPGPPTSLIVARIDVSVLEQEMLPAMIERHFGAVSPGEEPPYRVSVTDVSGPAPRQVFPDPAGAPGRTSTIPSGAADIQFRGCCGRDRSANARATATGRASDRTTATTGVASHSANENAATAAATGTGPPEPGRFGSPIAADRLKRPRAPPADGTSTSVPES